MFIYLNEIPKQNGDSTYNLRIPVTSCGLRLHLRIRKQLNLIIHVSCYLFVDSTKESGFHKNGCGYCKFLYFCSNFERYNLLSHCLWNPNQRRRPKKSSKVAKSAYNAQLHILTTYFLFSGIFFVFFLKTNKQLKTIFCHARIFWKSEQLLAKCFQARTFFGKAILLPTKFCTLFNQYTFRFLSIFFQGF